MIYFPETIDTISTVSLISPIYLHTFFLSYARELTLCMLASWSHGGVVFLDLLPSPHSVTSFLFPCPGSTDALCPCLGTRCLPLQNGAPIHRVRAHSLTGIRNKPPSTPQAAENDVAWCFALLFHSKTWWNNFDRTFRILFSVSYNGTGFNSLVQTWAE